MDIVMFCEKEEKSKWSEETKHSMHVHSGVPQNKLQAFGIAVFNNRKRKNETRCCTFINDGLLTPCCTRKIYLTVVRAFVPEEGRKS
jgi:hypothetical protein